MYRCPDDLSVRQADPGGDGVWNRTSYLLNSQLSHKTPALRALDAAAVRQRGRHVQLHLLRRAQRRRPRRDAGRDPKQDDFDIWLGTANIQPWIAYDRHTGVANYLYLDGHVAALTWDAAVPDLFPDHVVLTQDGSYPY